MDFSLSDIIKNDQRNSGGTLRQKETEETEETAEIEEREEIEDVPNILAKMLNLKNLYVHV